MQVDALFHLLFSDLRLDQYSLSHIEKPVILPRFQPLFHSDSTNINLIANLRMGDEIGHQSANFMYRSCCDTIRIQILNWSQRCRIRKMEPWSSSKPSPNPVGIPAFRVTTHTGLQPGNPEPLLTLHTPSTSIQRSTAYTAYSIH